MVVVAQVREGTPLRSSCLSVAPVYSWWVVEPVRCVVYCGGLRHSVSRNILVGDTFDVASIMNKTFCGSERM